jgi:hypothetical protein
MKKLSYLIVLTLILGLVLTGYSLLSNVGQVLATEQTKVKPRGNLAVAEEVAWNLSGDVMPVPPDGTYGKVDIPGSDTASKLIINQPNGNVEVAVTGVMNSLTPKTTYTVCLSNGYTPSGWNVSGSWVTIVNVGGTDLLESTPTRTAHFLGTIADDGTMSGSWADDAPGTKSGTWMSTDGAAEKTYTGCTGWPGLFNKTTVPEFTFTTDDSGSGSWHINLRNNDFVDEAGNHTLSVWINVGGETILISDSFTVVVD